MLNVTSCALKNSFKVKFSKIFPQLQSTLAIKMAYIRLILFTERVNVDLMSSYMHQTYCPRHYSLLAQLHCTGLKGSRPCLMFYAQGIWSAPSKGIRHQYTSYSLTERLFKILGKELNIHLMPLL